MLMGLPAISSAVAGPPTSPPSTGLYGWWSSDQAYTQTSGTPSSQISADGTGIGSLLDRSGNGNHVYQTSVGAQPVYKANIINTLPAARYNGAQSMATTSGGPTGDAFSIFAVVNETTAGSYNGIITNDGGLAPRYLVCDNNAANSLRVINTGTGAADTTFTLNTYHLVAATVDNTGAYPTVLQIDNNSAVSANAATGNGSLGNLQLGVFFNGSWLGDIVEVLLYTASPVLTLSSGDGLLARRYLNGRYNLGLGI